MNVIDYDYEFAIVIVIVPTIAITDYDYPMPGRWTRAGSDIPRRGGGSVSVEVALSLVA